MVSHVRVPVKEVRGQRWGALAYLSHNHEICGEEVRCIDSRYSFIGRHRVQLYKFRKNVFWRIPEGVSLDISKVAQTQAPRRQLRR